MVRFCKIGFFLTFLLGIQVVFAQSVRGKVTHPESGEPVVGATILILDAEKVILATYSNEDGEFQFLNVPEGKHILSVRSLGSESNQREVELERGESLEVFIELKESGITLCGVDIIVPKSEILRETPGTLTYIERKTVSLLQTMGTQEMLQMVPGINGFSDDGAQNSRINIGIRGLSPIRSSRVLFLEDGIPLQPALYVYPNMYYNPPAERVEEYEILKGSGALRFGPHTMGGVINYITSRPSNQFGGFVKTVGGTNSFRSLSGEVGGFGTHRLHPEIQFLYKGGNGYRQNNQFNQVNGTVKVEFIPDNKQNLYIKLNGNLEESQSTYTGLTEYSFAQNPRFNPKKNDEFSVSRLALDIIYTRVYEKRVYAVTKAYMSRFQRDWWREYDVFVDPAQLGSDSLVPLPWYTQGDLVRTGNGQSNYGNLRKFRMMGVEHAYFWDQKNEGAWRAKLEVGARLHWERFLDDRKEGNSPTDREGTYTTMDTAGGVVPLRFAKAQTFESTALSFFAMEHIQLGEKWKVTPGIRMEIFEQEEIDRMYGNIYSDKSTVALLPGLGFNRAMGKWNIFGGIHRGFTPPSSSSFSIWQAAGADSAGFDLIPEKSWNKELGVRVNQSYWTWELCAFHLSIQDMQASRGAIFTNLGDARTYGLELQTQVNLGKKWNGLGFLPVFSLSYTRLEAEMVRGEFPSALSTGTIDLRGKRLPYAPRHTATLGLTKEFRNGLSLHSDVYYVSLVYTDPENITLPSNRGDTGPIPSYWLLNASATWDLNPHWRLMVSGKNLTDRVYIGSRLFSSPLQPDANLSSGILPGPRIQINGGFTYFFKKS